MPFYRVELERTIFLTHLVEAEFEAMAREHIIGDPRAAKLLNILEDDSDTDITVKELTPEEAREEMKS